MNAQDYLNEARLMGCGGWAQTQFPSLRSELYLVIDQGWDVPYNTHLIAKRHRFGSLELPKDRFPHYASLGKKGLECLANDITALGWKGLGLWVAAQCVGDGDPHFYSLKGQARKDYWMRKVEDSLEAGIRYWKVDWGYCASDPQFCDLLTSCVESLGGPLWVEHSKGAGPLNDFDVPWDGPPQLGHGRYAGWGNVKENALKLLETSMVLRTYDVTEQLSVATTLDRVSELLSGARHLSSAGILNCEDEVYIAAVLGCSMGVMRSSLWVETLGVNYNPRQLDRKLTEVERAINWHRLAPPFSAEKNCLSISKELLTDSWLFHSGDTWNTCALGKEISQHAPAIIARGMGLPTVVSSATSPYVIASRHPNGSTSVATLPRTFPQRPAETCRAEVTLDVLDLNKPLGVFGHFKSLVLNFREPLRKSIYARDLAGGRWHILHPEPIQNHYSVRIDGAIIDKIGTEQNREGDISEPGLMIIFTEQLA